MTAAAVETSASPAARAVAGDAPALAALHRACLPGSILSALGAGVIRYYDFAIGSPAERVFAVRDGDRAIAGCVLSLAPPTLLGRFARREIDVLVGTQMIAKGHDFPAVTLVGVISADVGLLIKRTSSLQFNHLLDRPKLLKTADQSHKNRF